MKVIPHIKVRILFRLQACPKRQNNSATAKRAVPVKNNPTDLSTVSIKIKNKNIKSKFYWRPPSLSQLTPY